MPICFLVMWLPWSWKSTVSKIIAEKYSAVLLGTDVIRKELFATPNYSQQERETVFEELHKRLRENLLEWNNVIVDGVFAKQSERDNIKTISDETNSSFKNILVTAEEHNLEERIWKRTWDVSDADYEIYLFLKSQVEPIVWDYTTIDNSWDLESLREKINLTLSV